MTFYGVAASFDRDIGGSHRAVPTGHNPGSWLAPVIPVAVPEFRRRPWFGSRQRPVTVATSVGGSSIATTRLSASTRPQSIAAAMSKTSAEEGNADFTGR
jgi:hypothetical protein